MSTTAQTRAVGHIFGMSHHLQQTMAPRKKNHDLTKPLSELLAQQKTLLDSWGQLSDEEAWECSSLQLRKIESLLQAMNGTKH